MIQVEMKTNASTIIKELVAVEQLLVDATAVLDIIERKLPGMLAKRFEKFQAYAGSYKKKGYLEWKSSHLGVGLVGVYSWDLFKSIRSGAALEFEKTSDLGHGIAIHAWLDTSKFKDSYPIYFDQWLRKRGSQLMALEPEQLEELATETVNMIGAVLEGVF